MGKATIRLPAYVSRVRLASGDYAYFWKLPSWARPKKDKKTGKEIPVIRHGHPCPVSSAALGTSFDAMVEKADALNEALKEWRLGMERRTIKPGSVAWLFGWYREQDRYTRNRPKTQRDYRRLMDMLVEFPTKSGAKLGGWNAGSLDAGSVDGLYKKLRETKGEREASYAMQVGRLVWRWALRYSRTTGVTANPFAGMGIKSTASKENRATTRAEYDLYRETAREMGFQNMAAAAALCFEGCQRVSHVFGLWPDEEKERTGEAPPAGLQWSIWKPGIAIALTQRKTNNPVWLELTIEVDGETVELYPDLEQELRDLRERAAKDEFGQPTGQIILDERTGKPFTPRWLSTVHRRICDKAGLPKAMTFTGFRHGGITEIGDAGEDDVRPISGHKTMAQTRTYNKATAEKGRRIALKRREHVEQLGAREEVKDEA
ncbi:site-specific integrase [Sphingobium agri]|uniref:Tyr recombinase domain-containing protein n=1 Tax=Sphingobium agri TaxID=2933566 RepID=A0ABT0DWK2_9SPHN|nr:hypothetical protein [Sphingobium agri]MCK0531485.1 hypothetical protein [Sphingobium agri]